MSDRRADRGRRRSERPPWGREARLASSLGVIGAVLVISGMLLGTSLEGLSMGTWLPLAGVLTLAVAGALSVPSLIRNSREDPRCRPTLGLLAIVFIAAAVLLFVRFQAETAAGEAWDRLTAVLVGDEPGAAVKVVQKYKDIPEEAADLRLRFVKRIGELGDTRTAHFLETLMKDDADPAIRKAAAVGLGGMAGSERIDGLIRDLRGASRADTALLLEALRLATGADVGKTHGDWLRWSLLGLLDEGTPEAIETLVVGRLPELRQEETVLYEEIRGRLIALTDAALAPAFEKILGRSLEGARRLDRKVLAIIALGRLSQPRSIKPLVDAFARSRAQIAAKKMSPEQGNKYWDLIGRSLRLIAGKKVLDEERWAPVFELFVRLIEDENDVGEKEKENRLVRNFAADQLESMSGEKHGLDLAAWRTWREDETIRAYAAAGNITALIVDMKRCVTAKDVRRSARAIRALVGVGGDEARAAIRSLALRRSVEASIRSIALDAMAGAGGGLSRTDLLKLLEEEEHQGILRSVVLALAVLDEDSVAEALHERYLIEEDPVLRRTIVDALRTMTVDAVLAALVAAVRDEIPAVCEAAAKELEARTRKRFGVDPDKWEAWYKRNFEK